MSSFRALLAKPTVVVFWAWFAACSVTLLISLLDGSMHKDMLQAVDYAAAEGSEIVGSRDDTATSFIYISLAYFVAVTAIGALLVHRAAAGRKWAFVLLVPLALWWSFEALSSPITLEQMYPGTIGVSDWVFAVLGGAVWLFILVYTALARRRAAL
jgi:hypothetical protein